MDSHRPDAYRTPVHGFEQHLDAVEPLIARYGYGAVFLAIFVEGMGIPAPGQALLVAAALLAGRGELSIGLLLATAVLASAGGNLAGFYLGRWGGRRLLERIGAGPRLAKMEGLVQRRGGVLVGFGRFVDGTRQLAAIVAGSLDMKASTFFAWNVLGAFLWGGLWSLGPVLFERDAAQIALFFESARPVAIAAALLLLVLGLRWLVRGRRAAV